MEKKRDIICKEFKISYEITKNTININLKTVLQEFNLRDICSYLSGFLIRGQLVGEHFGSNGQKLHKNYKNQPFWSKTVGRRGEKQFFG